MIANLTVPHDEIRERHCFTVQSRQSDSKIQPSNGLNRNLEIFDPLRFLRELMLAGNI